MARTMVSSVLAVALAGAVCVPAFAEPLQVSWSDVTGSDSLAHAPSFFRDSLLELQLRSFYFDRRNFDLTRAKAWTDGGSITYQSGLLGDVIGVVGAYYTSQRLIADRDEGGTKLLAPPNRPLSVLAQAYMRTDLFGQELRAGRQLVDTPLLNPYDSRMVPIAFEGVTLSSIPDEGKSYDYTFGYIWKTKLRDSNTFVDMASALGEVRSERGAVFGMLRFRPTAELTATVMDYFIDDTVNTGFGQLEYRFPKYDNIPQFTIGLNDIDQRSVGGNLTGSPAFWTYQASGLAKAEMNGLTLGVVGSITGQGAAILSPFGSKPNYTDLQQVSFDNAGERAIGGIASYDFGRFGAKGLSADIAFVKGFHAIDPIKRVEIEDRAEYNISVAYEPEEFLKGLKLQARFSDLRQRGNARVDQTELRLIAKYTVQFSR
ncbi:outer membrane porin, OprD family [Rhizobiales bacterium GAS191]|nr:outer membrane porin, OprD family [Rhizobiales bacterium GAS113]SEE84594.1 outer membrane porin, OprD family [Rhizobiales bacterium GAS191]